MSKLSDTWVIIPIKGVGEPKRRLANVLSLQQRIRLQLLMAQHVLSELYHVENLDTVMVVSENYEYKEQLCKRSEIFYHYNEETTIDINRVLTKAAQLAQKQGATTIAIILADLPLLCANEVDQFIHNHVIRCDRPRVTLVSNRDGTGTNCLAFSPPFNLPYVFGHNSFDHYSDLAQKAGIEFCSLDLPSLKFDVDEPNDLMFYFRNTGVDLKKEVFNNQLVME